MVIKARGTRPAPAPAASSAKKPPLAKLTGKVTTKVNDEPAEETSVGELLTMEPTGLAKITNSRKLSLGGEDYFVSVGCEYPATADGMEDALTKASELVDQFMTDRVASLPDVDGALEGEDVTEEAEEAEADEAETADDEPTEEDVKAMKKPELVALLEQYEIEIDGFDKMKLPAQRDAVIEALFTDDAGEEAEGEEGEEAEEAEEGEAEEDADAPYTEEELGAMKLEELTEIATEWKLKVKPPAGANLASKKKAYVTAILKEQG